jgi:hypothetical protein
MSTLEGG